jgi:hypothetical protein
LQLEILALRHQLGVLQRSVKKPKLNRFRPVLPQRGGPKYVRLILSFVSWILTSSSEAQP